MNPTSPSAADDLDEAIGNLIVDTSRDIRRSLHARIAQHGLRAGTLNLLRVLWQQDGLTQREIAERLGLADPSVQEMLGAMEQDGLVLRERNPADRRKLRVMLTPRAQARSANTCHSGRGGRNRAA